jgi:hypothetical protein
MRIWLVMQTILQDKKAQRMARKEGSDIREEYSTVFALSTGAGNATYREMLIDDVCWRAKERATKHKSDTQSG